MPTFRSITLLLLCSSSGLWAQPTVISVDQLPALQAASERDPRAQADGEPWSVNLNSREEIRQFYNTIYGLSEGVPSGWSGNTTSGDAGTTTAAFKEAVRNRINFYRAMAGVPASVTINSTFSAKAQQAALMMSANNSLSHFPPTSWTHYTADGAEAAGASNIGIGSRGSDTVDGYMADPGASNNVVGHRRWLLYPQTQEMGTGDVEAQGSFSPANAIWVQDSRVFAARPTTREDFVAWPPKGHVPYHLVWPRWSISVPGANFSSATVTMTRNGSPINTTIDAATSGGGAPEPVLVWLYDNQAGTSQESHARPSADTNYEVTVSNVNVGGSIRNYSYTVTVFDPDVAGSDFTETTTSGTTSPGTGGASTYTVAAPSFGSGFFWREIALSNFSTTYGAEGGLQGVIDASDPSYSVRVTSPVASGNGAYHLAMPDFENEILTLPETYYVPANGSANLNYRSRLGFATTGQVTRVQVSTNDGGSWVTLAEQAGNGGASESSYQSKSLSLASFAGKTIQVRFGYFHTGGSAFNQTDPNVGWLIDDIAFDNVQLATVETQSSHTTGSTFAYTASSTGDKGLQARGAFFNTYAMGWGTLLAVTADSGTGSGSGGGGGGGGSGGGSNTSRIVNMSVRSISGTGAEALNVGMVVGGTGTKDLLIRVVGPTLGALGVTGVVPDPRLQLFRQENGANVSVATNDNWGSGTTLRDLFASLGAFALSSNLDAAYTSSLSTAVYPVIVDTKGSTGVVLVEAYDTESVTSGSARLVNVSARSQVGTGGDVLVAGFVIGGTGNKTLLIRGVGATLGDFGVPSVLANPQLIVRNSNTSAIVAENDNWNNDAAITARAQTLGAFPLSSTADAAVLVTLAPGVYTATVSGVNNTTGIALVEVYEVE